MKLRKERTHQSGLTNVDFRTKGDLDKVDHFQGNLKFTDFGTMTKSQYKRMPSLNNFKEQVAISGGWLNSKFKNEMFKNPKYETATAFYQAKAKRAKFPVMNISKLRYTQLEDQQWTDNKFVGDNKKINAEHSFFARQRDYELNKNHSVTGRQRAQDNSLINQRLFSKKPLVVDNKDNLENKVDLVRVRDARKALRRKYADRNTIDKIFEKYDNGNKGYIDVVDILNQARQIGLGISLEEAQVLIQSAKFEEKQNQKLSIEEYANLILSSDDKLDVNLKELKPIDISDLNSRIFISQRSQAPTEESDYIPPKNLFEDDYIVLDRKKVSQNVIENIENRTIRLNRKLKFKFGDAQTFDAKLLSEVKVDKNGNVSVDQLKDFILKQCETELINRSITKKDIEGFLSAFNYSIYGATNVSDISNLVFTSDDQVKDKLVERRRANPPPENLNADIDLQQVNIDDVHSKKTKSLINVIEDKVFNGKVKLYQVFKQFDKDGDGFVSYDDFQKCLQSIKVQASKEDIAQVLKLVDRNNQGYLSFQEFSQVFRPDMSDKLVKIPQNDSYHFNLAPSQNVILENIQKAPFMIDQMQETVKQFNPSINNTLKKSTRFGAKPDFGSTFVNFQHPQNAPGFLTEQERFQGTANNFLKLKEKPVGEKQPEERSGPLKFDNCLNTKVTFQVEDKKKAEKRAEARLNAKRYNHIQMLDNNVLAHY